jgi:hypothetical protein
MDTAMEALRSRMQRLLASLPCEEASGFHCRLPATEAAEAWQWPPEDARELLRLWEELGRPKMAVSPGITISNLGKWLNADWWSEQPEKHLSVVRRFLWEGLPSTEVRQANPLLEEWRRISIPEWRRILQESVEKGDNRREAYARWMLREVLADPEYRDQRP